MRSSGKLLTIFHACLFAIMRTGVPRINSCFESWGVVFLTFTESFFYFADTNNQNRVYPYSKEKEKLKSPYLEMRSLDYGGEFPSSQVPLLKLTAFCAPCSPLTPRTRFLPIRHLFTGTVHTDDIHMPAIPIGHNTSLLYILIKLNSWSFQLVQR